ncbi:hypothetical protein PBT90_12995 [Algoriphagus halophytocola]|uniref:hypothetical protein n=1 Tax=Algoriphagus halophytocola TaxID=2991499 RepID=UPI0022DE4060|nr:hypothetical protein [Algoriphagus sp. TR-M9]WBL41672.1 hypothetical protein PBT90_12995 [Algoriphagus sp. TR-M9]
MKKVIFILSLCLPLLIGCKEDESKEIQTDLTIEAQEIYGASSALSEPLFFVYFGYENYKNLDSIPLPGCPEILVDDSLKQVRLNFKASEDCTLSEVYVRSGEIILNYDSISNVPDTKITLNYNSYAYGPHSLSGSRTFELDEDSVSHEKFENLLVNYGSDVSSEISGEYNHTLIITDEELSQISSLGQIKGRNPAGRKIEINLISPKIQSKSCFSQNLMLPSGGKESWLVQRGESTTASYAVTYDPVSTCDSNVFAVLPDGKTLLLNPE